MIINQFSFPSAVWSAPPSSFASVISHAGLGCSDTFCWILLLVYFFPHKHTHRKSFPRKHCLSFSVRNRKPSKWKRLCRNIMRVFLFLTNPKKSFRCARNQLSVNINCFEELLEVLMWPKILSVWYCPLRGSLLLSMPKLQLFLEVQTSSWAAASTLPSCSMPCCRGACWQK